MTTQMRLFNVRMDEQLLANAGERAALEGVTLSDLVRGWFEDYVRTGAVGRRRKVRLSAAERDAVHDAIMDLNLLTVVVDTINEERG